MDRIWRFNARQNEGIAFSDLIHEYERNVGVEFQIHGLDERIGNHRVTGIREVN